MFLKRYLKKTQYDRRNGVYVCVKKQETTSCDKLFQFRILQRNNWVLLCLHSYSSELAWLETERTRSEKTRGMDPLHNQSQFVW